MNTSALKLFAQQARKLLREGVERRINYWGFDKNGKNTAVLESVTGGYTFRGKVSDDTSAPSKWNKLKFAIDHSGFDDVVEKSAYTWFNRLMAMKILSKNGYETAQLDYLSDETHSPAILERARRGQYTFLTNSEKQRLQPLLTDYEKEQDAFGILLIGYCHHHSLLQAIFGAIDDYTELLLPDDILTENGFLNFLNTTAAISDDDYKQVELIGWLYQFYNSEKKDEVFAGFKQNKKAEAKDIPVATQIFTPNWIVKYLVQNTLGRTWLDAHPDSDLKKDWKYLVEPSAANAVLTESGWNKALEELTFLDPAAGSGHILVEAFDILYPMYLAEYYSEEEAVQRILEKNIFGLDLDQRTVHLAQFAVILKAAQYNRTILQGKILPHIYAMPEQRNFSKEEAALFLGIENQEHVSQLYQALQTMEQAHNLGSVMVLELSAGAGKAVAERYQWWQKKVTINIDEQIIKEAFPAYIQVLIILTSRFTCIAANPPYMGRGNMNDKLKQYLEENYPNSKSDLYTVFIDACLNRIQHQGRIGLINPPSWMFNISYLELRRRIVENTLVESFLNFGRGIFGADFGTVSYTLKSTKPPSEKLSVFRNLFRGKSLVDSIEQKREWFFDKSFNAYEVNQLNFTKIDSIPFAYWLNDKMFDIFSEHEKLSAIADAKVGLQTGDNDCFRRNWPEVSFHNTSLSQKSNAKWFPYNSGGEFRKWYGNQNYFVNWQEDGKAVKAHSGSVTRNAQYYFQESISWSKVTIGGLAFRSFPKGFIFDVAGCSIFFKNKKDRQYLLGLLNSCLKEPFVYAVSQSVNYEVGIINNIPIIYPDDVELIEKIGKYVDKNIEIAKKDWDRHELSWDFQSNNLIVSKQKNIGQAFHHWVQEVSKDFFQLHKNEEELNKMFIEIYNLQGELSVDVPLKDITILQEELDYDALKQMDKLDEGELVPVRADVVMQQFISYIIGCCMGRYRLDKPGLHIAHPNPTEEELVPYFVQTGEEKHFQFQIDDDAIIPLMGSNGNFTDDMLHRVKEFLSIVWGDDGLTANINYLQQHLDKNLEEYLVKDFWKYHVRTYSKKPVYWLFASRKGAFQVLIYMHRMSAFSVVKIRSKYLIPHLSWLQNRVIYMEKNSASLSKTELKKLDFYRKQLLECEEYDLLLKDVADKQIDFDLDDGVTKNYALFKGVVAEIK